MFYKHFLLLPGAPQGEPGQRSPWSQAGASEGFALGRLSARRSGFLPASRLAGLGFRLGFGWIWGGFWIDFDLDSDLDLDFDLDLGLIWIWVWLDLDLGLDLDLA